MKYILKVVFSIFIINFVVLDFQAYATSNDSLYEKKLVLPVYDRNNPEMALIKSNADWSKINDRRIRFFFVVPGDYSSAGKGAGRIAIKSSGSASKKRYILLHNGNNTHPGKLPKSKLAKVGLVLENANHWVIDRMGYWESSSVLNPVAIKNSDNNIVNRYFMSNVGNGIALLDGSDNNIIQNCRIQRNDISIRHDRPAIGISAHGRRSVQITNNKILSNEVYNYVDGVQTVRRAGNSRLSYEGTIIDNNHFYIDKKIYTNGKGRHDPAGQFAYAENAIDLKVGSASSSKPMIITNNKMWGYRKSDRTRSRLSSHGTVVAIHHNVNNTVFKDNVIFDSAVGINITTPYQGYSMQNAVIKNNIFYDIKKQVLYMSHSRSIAFEGNLFKDVARDHKKFVVFDQGLQNVSFVNNTVLNAYNKSVTMTGYVATRANNKYYKAQPGQLAGAGDTVSVQQPDSGYSNLVFTTDNYTNSPRRVTLSQVIKGTANTSQEIISLPEVPTGITKSVIKTIPTPQAVAGTTNGTAKAIPLSEKSISKTNKSLVITSHTEGQKVPARESFEVKVDINDPDGVRWAVFYIDGKRIASDRTFPYSTKYPRLSPGQHKIAVHYKTLKNKYTQKVLVSVDAVSSRSKKTASTDRKPVRPSHRKLVITSHTEGQRVSAGKRFRVNADISDPDGVRWAIFYIDGKRVGWDRTYPYSMKYPKLSPGRHRITVNYKTNKYKYTKKVPLNIIVK